MTQEEVTALINQWWAVESEIEKESEKLAVSIKLEQDLRRQLSMVLFPNPLEVEGTNYTMLGAGWRLKTVIKIKRTVDEAALGSVKELLQKQLINADQYFRVKTELEVKVYKEATGDVRKVIDQALLIKPEMPTMEVVPPKPDK